VCEQLEGVDCRRPFGVRGEKKERTGGRIWELILEVVTHPWREAGCCMQPIGARVIYQAATAIVVQVLTKGDLQCVCVAW
jgi:hypothetical protein